MNDSPSIFALLRGTFFHSSGFATIRSRIFVSVDASGCHTPRAFMGILRVTCTLGDKIPASASEGVRLVVQDVINFNKEVSGLTLFIKT